MDRVNWDRWAPASGILAVACWVATFFLPAKKPPDAGDPGAKFTAFLTDHRTALLVGAYIGLLGVVFFIWFLGSLVTTMRDRGEPRVAAIAFGAGLLGGGLALFAFTMQTALAWGLGTEVDGAIVKTLVLGPNFAIMFPIAALSAAAAIAALRSEIFPQWYGAAGLIATAWFLIGGAALARDGFFSPQGGFVFIGLIAFFAWLLLTSILLLRQMPEEAPTTAAIPAA